jgi:hypothetical protein
MDPTGDSWDGNDQFSGPDYISPEKQGTPSIQTFTFTRHLVSTHLDYGSNTTGKEGQVDHRVKRARPAEQDDHNNAPNQVAMSKLEL